MNQQCINLSGSAIFFEDIEIIQDFFIAMDLVQDLTKLVLSLRFRIAYRRPPGSKRPAPKFDLPSKNSVLRFVG